MANNKNKVDALHDLLPKHFSSRTNPNWKALIDALGSADQDTSDLVSEVRKQFFVKTASRPYLDRLAANNMIARPRLVGMDDPSFREYIPILSYQPKQVKHIIDQLLDIFFFKESTTAFVTSQKAEPFPLVDGWELEYIVDELNDERIIFNQDDFTDIANATANEVVASINRQAKFSYATAEYDSITKSTFIRLFTKTIGSKGSLRLEGGRANIALQFTGFLADVANGSSVTTWTPISWDNQYNQGPGGPGALTILPNGGIQKTGSGTTDQNWNTCAYSNTTFSTFPVQMRFKVSTGIFTAGFADQAGNNLTTAGSQFAELYSIGQYTALAAGPGVNGPLYGFDNGFGPPGGFSTGATQNQTDYIYVKIDATGVVTFEYQNIIFYTYSINASGKTLIPYVSIWNLGSALTESAILSSVASNTEWIVTKIGDQVTFTYSSGANPNIDLLQEGDVAILSLPGNNGSFPISNVDLTNQSFTFTNLFGTPGTYTQTDPTQVKFLRPQKFVAYLNPKRAMTWETSPGEITVEMPTSPPVVKRSLKGSGHINGVFSAMTNRDDDTSITVADAYQFPESGQFILEPVNEIQTHILTGTEDFVISKTMNGRLISKLQYYTYLSRLALATTGDIQEGVSQISNLASTVGLAQGQQVVMDGVPPYARVTSISGNIANLSHPATATGTGINVEFLGNQLTGISPALPEASSVDEHSLTSLIRSSNVVTATASLPHGFQAGEPVVIVNSSGITTLSTTGNRSIGSNLLTSLASTTGIAPDMLITGTGIPSGTKVLSISGTTVVMSQNATANVTGGAVSFSEDMNGTFIIQSVTSNTFTYNLVGSNGTASTAGLARVERIGLSSSGSNIYITNAIDSSISRIKGPYIWDLAAPFTLSSSQAELVDSIQAGKIVRLLNVGPNDMPASGGFLIFDYGLNSQEGPVRYLYKPTSTTIALDPSYTFKHNHSVGSAAVLISHNGPHVMSTRGDEYPPYITDPSEARFILEDLIRSVKSAGIFVNFLVHYPDQLYATLDVYSSGIDPG